MLYMYLAAEPPAAMSQYLALSTHARDFDGKFGLLRKSQAGLVSCLEPWKMHWSEHTEMSASC